MDDLISRQSAIDALNEQIEQCDKALSSFDILVTDEYAVKVERASLVAYKEQLEFLPSAQPEQQWIPCSERLPEKSGLYLTWTKFPYEEEPSWLIINYDADCEPFGEWEEHYHPDTLGYLDSEFNEFENVFAWMPLPEPYREDGEADD